MDIGWIKQQVNAGNYQLSLHAMERASTRGIDPLEAKEALLDGEIIEDYPEDKRGRNRSRNASFIRFTLLLVAP